MGLRRTAVAGSWYPGEARAIAAEVEGYLRAVPATSWPGTLVALISPHAGLRYSGPVASSDLSHYHPAPVANALDARVVGDIERFDPEALMDRLETEPGHACGGGPMVAVMKAARALGADRAAVLRYADSGDAGEKNKTRVVGYVSAALGKAAP